MVSRELDLFCYVLGRIFDCIFDRIFVLCHIFDRIVFIFYLYFDLSYQMALTLDVACYKL